MNTNQSIFNQILVATTILPFAFCFSANALAFDISDSLTVEGTLTGIVQHGELDDTVDADGNDQSDTGRGAIVLDVGINFHPTDNDEFQIVYGFAEGQALNGLESFSVAPFADDLEEDLSDINSSGRYNLLEAWYKHNFVISDHTSLGITFGIVGSTGYIDANEYANDEIGQFLNEVFVNNPVANLPDYDSGAVIEFASGSWSMEAVVMNSENDDDNHYNYYALQLGYQAMNSWGEGNYRVFVFTTSDDFIDVDGTDEDSLNGFGISFDQQISDSTGLFLRAGVQDDDVPITHDQMISLGINIMGNAWNRPDDNIGIGIAFLDGADDSDIKDTSVVEAYYKLVILEFLDATLDAQWIKDEVRDGDDPEGLLIGVRANAHF